MTNDFAVTIFRAFGDARFTIAEFVRISGRMPGRAQNERVRKQLEGWTPWVLLAAPGPRGGDGWKLRPDVAAALQHRKLSRKAREAQKGA